MSYPRNYTNIETKKTYNVTLSQPGKLFLIKATCTPTEWGSVEWEIKDSEFLLHTIQSHPEKGSGLGSLLMSLAALEAQLGNCEKIKVLSAALSKREFYFSMGCFVDTSALASFNQEEFSKEEWAQLSGSCPVVADTVDVVVKSSKSVFKRWTC